MRKLVPFIPIIGMIIILFNSSKDFGLGDRVIFYPSCFVQVASFYYLVFISYNILTKY